MGAVLGLKSYFCRAMTIEVLYSKIHRVRVTGADLNYIGSITIDADLLDACGMRVNDVVLIANCENGARFETYVFRGAPGSRTIGLNGAAAKLVSPGDRVIIMHWPCIRSKRIDAFTKIWNS